jgi:teichuronic acid biosynthesis glycosyltransferase TuaC
MNVLIVSRLYPLPKDPVLGIFVEEEARELARLCNVKVVSPVPWFPPLKLLPKWYDYSQLPLREMRKGLEIHRPRTMMFPRNILFLLLGFSFYLALRRWVDETNGDFPIDLIHAHTAYPDGFAAVMLGKALDLPTIITLHGGDVTLHFQHYFGRKLGLWAVSSASHVLVVSESLRRTVVDDYGADREKITVIPNGVDVTRFEPIPQREAQNRLGLGADSFRMLYVGAITRSKGIEYLLRALRLLRKSQASAELVLVGEGDYQRQAMSLADEMGIAGSVTFAGQRPNEEIPLWMNACDLLVLPSLAEGFGVVLIEAMACGRPVVATACGGPEDIVTPQTGILVPPGDEFALSQALLDALSTGTRFSPDVIRQRAVDNYALDRISSRIMELYRQVLQG